MKTSLLSVVAALSLLVSTAASAAAPYSHSNDRRTEDVRRMSPAERSRYESAQREKERKLALEKARYQEQQRKLTAERARLQAQHRAEQQKAAERARWEAQHRNDKGHDYGYNGR
jgi:cell division protein FtsN